MFSRECTKSRDGELRGGAGGRRWRRGVISWSFGFFAVGVSSEVGENGSYGEEEERCGGGGGEEGSRGGGRGDGGRVRGCGIGEKRGGGIKVVMEMKKIC